MKLIEGKIYMEHQEMLAAGVPKGTLDYAINKGVSSWKFMPDPSDGRKVLVQYDTLKEKYKTMITLKYGDPNEAHKSKPLEAFMVAKTEDVEFLQNYRLPNGNALPTNTLNDYIHAVKVLHFIHTTGNKEQVRAIGFCDLHSFYLSVSSYIQTKGVALPKDRNKLQAKVKTYATEGPSCIISSKFCNKNSSKVTDEVAAALLLSLIGHHAQFEDTFVAIKYNEVAMKYGWKTITPATVTNYRHRHALELTASRSGQAVWRNRFDKSVHQERPSAPLLLINSDDNVLDLYFTKESSNKKGHKTVNYYHRVTLMVVMDSYNDYPLGYAIGEGQTIDLVKEAYLNAVHHVKELTGGYYLWQQIKADSWGLAALGPWYERQATFTPPRTGNARGKVIEQAFGNNWHRLLRQYPNYAGHNITAKKKINPDAIQLEKKNFPSVAHAPEIIKDFINRLRNQSVQESGKTRQELWLEGWNSCEQNRKKELPTNSRLLLFGKRHEYTNTITKDGLNVTLNGNKMVFEVPAPAYKAHIGKTLRVAYDPYDLTAVLACSEDESIQIVCPIYERYKMAIADFTPGDRHRLNVMLGEKRELSQWVLDEKVRRQQVLSTARIDAESILQAGIFTKELKGEAEEVYVQALLGSSQNTDAFDDLELPTENLNTEFLNNDTEYED